MKMMMHWLKFYGKRCLQFIVLGAYVFITPSITAFAPRTAPLVIAGCNIFPADNIWNTPIDTLPIDVNSDLYVATIGADENLHPDFGAGDYPPGSGAPIGIPYVVISDTQPEVGVVFKYDSESDAGPYGYHNEISQQLGGQHEQRSIFRHTSRQTNALDGKYQTNG